jgi:hypothetical protein
MTNEVRMPKSERSSSQSAAATWLALPSFGFRHSFVIRISSLVISFRALRASVVKSLLPVYCGFSGFVFAVDGFSGIPNSLAASAQ